ncbi:MAG TPA: MBL fold metallo-hydrolase [Gemmatimonadales bacterium]|nr:MBL fold metallo-hydrolase [Gemmatimonadales bacterium]
MNGLRGSRGWIGAGLAALLGCGAEPPLLVSTINAAENGFSVTSTLIAGERDAILVDAQFTLSDGARVADWIVQSGKRLKTVFITHGHPDHFFGLAPIVAKFPDAEVLATPAVIEEMRAYAPQALAQWKPVYGADLTDQPIFPKPFSGDSLVLESRRIDLVTLRPAESSHATALWIPSLQTVVAGDAAFNGVHVWLAGVDAERRESWLGNLRTLAALGPRVVIAGHRAPGVGDSATVLDSTARYIRDFSQAVATSRTPDEVIAKVTATHGSRTLPVILDLAARAALGGTVGRPRPAP